MKIILVDRIVAAVTPLALLLAGFMLGTVADRSEPVGRFHRITEDSPLWRTELDTSPVWPTDQELIISLTGEPLTDCYTFTAAMEYADSLAHAVCSLVTEQLG